ncbi:7021_t:CDS:2, partial [Funneliformis geosporum]
KQSLEKPSPYVSDHSTPTSDWSVLICHKSRVNASHFTIEELKRKLKDYDIDTISINNRAILPGILQNRLDKEISEQNKDTSNTETASTNSDSK